MAKHMLNGEPCELDLDDTYSAELLAAEPTRHASIKRSIRDSLLAETDWTQVADAPADATTWATYRQALRDITTHTNWPNLSEPDWPAKPA